MSTHSRRARRSIFKPHLLSWGTLLVGGLGSAVCAGLTMWSSNSLPSFSGDCSLREEGRTNKMDPFYSLLMRTVTPEISTHSVALVTIDPTIEPLSIVSNVCEGRLFIASLLEQLQTYGPRVIAIDKFYSADACTDEKPQGANDSLRAALHAAPARIVVGQATHARPNAADQNDCLVTTKLFDFYKPGTLYRGPGADGGPNWHILTGLTRLNKNTLKIPLLWWVFSKDEEARRLDDVASVKEKSFALVAAESADPTLRYNRDLLELMEKDQHPFAAFPGKLPTWSASDVLCSRSTGQKQMQQHNWGKCEVIPDLGIYFKDKVVVVGEHVESDKQSFPTNDIFGVDLQAKYIEALLHHGYKHQAPWFIDSGLILFVTAVTFFIDFLLCFIADNKLKQRSELLIFAASLTACLIAATVSWRLLLRGFFTPVFFIAIPGVAIVLLTSAAALTVHLVAAKRTTERLTR